MAGDHGRGGVAAVLERRSDALYLHWLTLRDPRARFGPQRPQRPGQEVPGLGVSAEVVEVIGHIASGLRLPAVVHRPSWFHIAYALRRLFRFADPARQGRLEAMLRDLAALSPAANQRPTRALVFDVGAGRWTRLRAVPHPLGLSSRLRTVVDPAHAVRKASGHP